VPFGPAPSLNSQAARCACVLVCNPLRLLQPAPSRWNSCFRYGFPAKGEFREIWDFQQKNKKENKGKKGWLNSKFKAGFHLQ